jgi:hypothetical protein
MRARWWKIAGTRWLFVIGILSTNVFAQETEESVIQNQIVSLQNSINQKKALLDQLKDERDSPKPAPPPAPLSATQIVVPWETIKVNLKAAQEDRYGRQQLLNQVKGLSDDELMGTLSPSKSIPAQVIYLSLRSQALKLNKDGVPNGDPRVVSLRMQMKEAAADLRNELQTEFDQAQARVLPLDEIQEAFADLDARQKLFDQAKDLSDDDIVDTLAPMQPLYFTLKSQIAKLKQDGVPNDDPRLIALQKQLKDAVTKLLQSQQVDLDMMRSRVALLEQRYYKPELSGPDPTAPTPYQTYILTKIEMEKQQAQLDQLNAKLAEMKTSSDK